MILHDPRSIAQRIAPPRIWLPGQHAPGLQAVRRGSRPAILLPRSYVAASAGTPGAETSDAYLANTKYHMNSYGLSDISPSDRDIYATPGVATSTAQARSGTNSIFFAQPSAGEAAFIRIPYSTDFAYGSGDFTWEVSCYRTVTTSSSSYLISQGNELTTGQNELSLFVANSGANNGKLVFSVTVADANVLSLVSSSSFTSAAWQDVLVAKSGSNYYLLVNGAVQATGSYATALPADIASTVTIGNASIVEVLANPENFNWIGYMAGVRITTGVARRTSAYTVLSPLYATTPNPTLAYDASFSSVTHLVPCESANGRTFTSSAAPVRSPGRLRLTRVGTATISTAQSRFGSASMYFDGSAGGRFAFNSGLGPALGSGDWTIEAFIRPDSASFDGDVFSHYPSGFAPFWILRLTTSKTVRFVAANNSGGTVVISDVTSAGSVTANVWTHIAACRVSGVVTVYVAGVGTSGGTNLSTAYQFPSATFCFGGDDGGGTEYRGYIDAPRITVGVARYTANFTPPTAQFLYR